LGCRAVPDRKRGTAPLVRFAGRQQRKRQRREGPLIPLAPVSRKARRAGAPSGRVALREVPNGLLELGENMRTRSCHEEPKVRRWPGFD